MTAPRSSPREGEATPAAARRVVQVLLGVALVALALAAPVRPQSDVEVRFGGNGTSPCLAQVAGLVESQVLWFNGVPFFERRDFTGDTHLYVTEKGSPDPTNHLSPEALAGLSDAQLRNMSEAHWEKMPFLVRSGTWYNFTDANGVEWNVTEAFFDVGVDSRSETGDPEAFVDGDPEVNVRGDGDGRVGTKRYFVWIVQLDEVRDDQNMGVPADIGDMGEYNFATRVNTSKFTADTREASGTYASHGANATADRPEAEPGCHPDHNHTHRQYQADVWLGQDPDLVPLDCEPVHGVSAAALAQFSLGGRDPTVNGSERGGTCTGINGTEVGFP
jgi:hypothetical protein